MIIEKMIKDERGITAAFLAVLMLVLIAFTGLILDGGLLMCGKLKLSAASDSAILSVIKAYNEEIWHEENKIVLDKVLVEKYVTKYLKENMKEAHIDQIKIASMNKVEITTYAEIETVFMKIFGIDKKRVYITVKCVVG